SGRPWVGRSRMGTEREQSASQVLPAYRGGPPGARRSPDELETIQSSRKPGAPGHPGGLKGKRMRETPFWRRYLRLLGNNPAADVEDELQFHLAMRVDDLMR